MNILKYLKLIILSLGIFFSINALANTKVLTDGDVLNFSGFVDVHIDPNFSHSYIDGKEAKIHIFNENFVEVTDSNRKITVSLSKDDNGEWSASWTGKHGKNGILKKEEYKVVEENDTFSKDCPVAPGKRIRPC